MNANDMAQSINDDFVLRHREDDVRKLALKKMPPGVDALWCMQQIEGWQLARRKLPRWALTEGLYYPPRISMEQCSSEQTALYKRRLVQRLLEEEGAGEAAFADLTGGFGIDFSYLASLFRRAVYVERQAHLCDIARHNFHALGLHHAEVVNEEVSATSRVLGSDFSLLFLDPARRDGAGRKVVALEDCMPNLVELQHVLRHHARFVLVKLSPMLDIRQALRQLRGVVEVHVVSVQGECKELLLLVDSRQDSSENPAYCCADLPASLQPAPSSSSSPGASVPEEPGGSLFCVTEEPVGSLFCVPPLELSVPSESSEFSLPFSDEMKVSRDSTASLQSSSYASQVPLDLSGILSAVRSPEGETEFYLYEPNASVLKAGVQDALPEYFSVQKIHRHSNLFVSREFLPTFPGRGFRILSVGDFSKRSLKVQLKDIVKANLTLRNFPGTVDALRRQLKLKEGGEDYLFATTWADGQHVLILCRK